MTLVHLKGFLYPPPSRSVGAGDACIAFPDFDRSVNAITTRRHRLIAQHITTRTPPDFHTFLRPCLPPPPFHALSWAELQCRVSSVPGKYMEGFFFFTIFTAAPWLWLLALFFVVGCPGEDTGYIFHLFFIGLKLAKLLKSNMVGNIKHFQIHTFSWSHIVSWSSY